MIRNTIQSLILLVEAQPALAATFRVPEDHPSIQAAIDASGSCNITPVAPGRYFEHLGLKPKINENIASGRR